MACMYMFTAPAVNTTLITHKVNSPFRIQSIVFIAMGDLAKETIVDNAVASLRVLGKWSNDIHIITDKPDCFSHLISKHHVHIAPIPSVNSIIEIKAMKTKLFEHLPANITNVLYLDVDILVTRNLDLFLGDLYQQVEQYTSTHKSKPDFGMFLDAGGHFFGFCSGCEKWHTGVIWVDRNSGQECMSRWREILLSGKYDTDQESIDEAERSGACKNTLSIPAKHLLFAKDYFAAVLTPSRTFVHLTAISRMDTQDFFYKNYVVPSIKSSLRPNGLNLRKEEKFKKMCS